MAPTLLGIGFVNMIIPCPAAAIMFGYAFHSGDVVTATVVFASYAVSTAISVGAVIFIIFRVAAMAVRLQKEWIEPLIMRIVGGMVVIFSGLGIYRVVAGT